MLPTSQRRALQAFREIAQDLAAPIAPLDRYSRLLESVRRIVPCDAACLLQFDRDDLLPIAAHGLCPQAMARRYARLDHPRLSAILDAHAPLLFPTNSPMPDPFDGQLESPAQHVHACPV